MENSENNTDSLDAITYSYLDRISKSEGTVLNLSNHGLNPRWGLALSCFLSRAGEFITTLDLSNNFLGCDGVDFLCKHLKDDQRIISLDLSCNDINSNGEYYSIMFIIVFRCHVIIIGIKGGDYVPVILIFSFPAYCGRYSLLCIL